MKTFTFKDVTPGIINPNCQKIKLDSVIQKRLIVQHSTPGYSGNKNALMSAMEGAYNLHVPLILRPDDLWLAICSAFANYVITHAEEMRSVFVSFEGKKELEILSGGCFATGNWNALLELMGREIDKNLNTKCKDWLTPTFSTTTNIDKLVSQIQLMGAMQKYFDYKFTFCCGLSSVTLEGTEQDWVDLYSKAARLSEFGKDLETWSNVLLPVLNQFIEAYRGNVDEAFWQRIATSESRGSGGQQTFIGWYLVFSPFNAKGDYQLNSLSVIERTNVYGSVDDSDIISTVISVPVSIDDNGNKFQTIFYGGLSHIISNSDGSIRPSVSWGIEKIGDNS